MSFLQIYFSWWRCNARRVTPTPQTQTTTDLTSTTQIQNNSETSESSTIAKRPLPNPPSTINTKIQAQNSPITLLLYYMNKYSRLECCFRLRRLLLVLQCGLYSWYGFYVGKVRKALFRVPKIESLLFWPEVVLYVLELCWRCMKFRWSLLCWRMWLDTSRLLLFPFRKIF